MDLVLAAYIVTETSRFVPRYGRLKQALANGDKLARMRIYYRALAFEWISGLLALLALGFDWGKLNPGFLGLEDVPLIRRFSLNGEAARGMIAGVAVGMAVGLAFLIVARLKANRRSVTRVPEKPAPPWRRLLPDFSALIPVTLRERLLWAAVAISAGICEEIVFRGWLLATLHGRAGLAGTALILSAAAVFGLAHAYQGISGMILTALAGGLFCVLYVVTGSLLAPILLHALVDLRFALLPTSAPGKRRAAYA